MSIVHLQAKPVLVVVDVQDKLTAVMHDRDFLITQLCRLIDGTRILQVPVIWVEQTPARMGPTIPQLAERLTGLTPIPKTTFSCVNEPRFMATLRAHAPTDVILAGIEAHVCIAQTAAGLVKEGFNVHVAADAVSSRTPANRQIGLDLVRQRGGLVTGVESILFELLVSADHPAFRDVLRIVK